MKIIYPTIYRRYAYNNTTGETVWKPENRRYANINHRKYLADRKIKAIDIRGAQFALFHLNDSISIIRPELNIKKDAFKRYAKNGNLDVVIYNRTYRIYSSGTIRLMYGSSPVRVASPRPDTKQFGFACIYTNYINAIEELITKIELKRIKKMGGTHA